MLVLKNQLGGGRFEGNRITQTVASQGRETRNSITLEPAFSPGEWGLNQRSNF